jgi:hypothetical protein
MKKDTKGIYCLEIGEWMGSAKKMCSMEPMLQLLLQSPQQVPYIHRDIATKPELLFYLKKWTRKQYADYPILYLAFHGSPGGIHLSGENGREVKLDTEELLSQLSQKCEKRMVHFGSCGVLNIKESVSGRFLKESGAVAISGYGSDVEWIKSSVVDIMFLSEMQAAKMTKAGVKEAYDRTVEAAPNLIKSLQFRIRTRH